VTAKLRLPVDEDVIVSLTLPFVEERLKAPDQLTGSGQAALQAVVPAGRKAHTFSLRMR